jgi:hypothetical protein
MVERLVFGQSSLETFDLERLLSGLEPTLDNVDAMERRSEASRTTRANC